MIQNGQTKQGMRIITERIPHAISISVGIWILRGSRNEPSECSGITHFIEHLLFKGSKTRTAVDISREIESVGGSLNAFTGKEFMCLHARVLYSHLALVMELLSDIFLHPVLPKEEIEKERQVVLQEIQMIEDSPEELIHELFAGSYWRDQPLGRSTLGTNETITPLDREELLSFLKLLQDPTRVILTVAGNLTHENVKDLAEKYFDFPAMDHQDITLDKPSIHQGLHLHLKELGQAHICIGTLGYHHSHPRRYAYHVLNTLLGGGMSSRLFQEIREKRGLAYSVYSFQSSFLDTGMLGMYVGTNKDAVAQVIQLLLDNLTSLKNEEVTLAELTTAKEQLKGNLLLSTESTGSRMSKLAMNQIFFGKQLIIEDVINDIDQVKECDILEISSELFRSEFLSLTVLGDIDRDALTEIKLVC